MTKFALINFGNEESYGLLFAGEEFKKHGDIHFFDAEFSECVSDIVDYSPDFLCFSPMTTFFNKAKKIEEGVKSKRSEVVSVYGGHHATNCGRDCGDITVVGAVHGFDPSRRGRVFGGVTSPRNLKTTAREEYWRDIPRMKTRYRKVMLSVVGCPFSCSYCSSASEKVTRLFGPTREHLMHRDMDDIFAEARHLKPYTEEIEWVDDDIFYGDQDWLVNFFERWDEEIGLPMYVSCTSLTALKASEKVLRTMRKSVNCIGMGVQASRPESLKLLNRQWDNQGQIREAYTRLTDFGYRVNLQAIVGLPLADPVDDALDTVEFLTSVGKGSIVSVYPMQVYPNTRMETYCREQGFKFNEFCEGDTNTGVPCIDFGDEVNNRIKNICKLATMVVKYGISRDWLEAMLDIDVSGSSQALSLIRYYECMRDRLPEKVDDIFSSVTKTMHLRH